MKKKFLAVFLLAILLAMSMAQVAWANVYGQWQTIDGVTTVRCTYYAWEQVYSNHGISLPNWGNGGSWLAGAQRDGYATGTVPRAGSLAVWTSGLGIPSGHGHVAYVTAVRSNGKIVCNEGGITPTDKNSNVVSQYGIYNGHVIPNDYRGMPQGYIYLDKVPEPAPKPVDPLPSADFGKGFYAYIYNPASGYYVENANQNAQLGSKREGDLSQLWYFSSGNDLSYRIVNMADGSSLNVEGGKFAVHTNVNLIADPAKNSISHKWYLCGRENECYIASAYANGKDLVLDVFYGIGEAPIPLEGRNIWLCDNCYKNGEGFHAAETFQIIKVDPKTLAANLGSDFYARISYLGAKNSYLTIDDEARSSGTTQYRRIETIQKIVANDPRQIWRFVRTKNGYYYVSNEYTGWRMNLRGGSPSNGEEVVSWGENINANNQRWFVYGSAKTGRYNLVSAANYPWSYQNIYLLNVPVSKPGATAPDGTNTDIALLNGGSSQFAINIVNYTKPAQPAAPTGLTVSTNENGATFKWNAVPTAKNWDERGYQVTLYKVLADGTEKQLENVQVGNVTSYTKAGALEPGNYQVTIQALNKRYRSWASGIVQKNFTIYNNYTVSVNAQAGGSANGGGTYREGLPVSLTATPSSGYQFAGWQDAANEQIVSTEAVYTFTANANRTLTACFAKIPEPVVPTYRVTVSAGVGGAANGGGIYKQGQTVALRAVADAGYRFVGWQETGSTDLLSQEASYSFVAAADRNLTALFEQLPVTDPDQPTPPAPTVKYSVRLSAEPAKGGTVRGGGIYNEGESVTVQAEANNGWHFASWQVGNTVVSTQSVYSLRADADVQLVANFVEATQPGEPEAVKTYTINLSSTMGGTVSGSGSYHAGETVTVRAVADVGYKFVRWQENEEVLSDKAEYTFNALADCDLVAVFATLTGDEQKLLYTIVVNAAPAAGGTVTGGGVYEQNKQVVVKAVVNSGYTFDGWQDMNSGSLVSTEAEYSFAAVENRELVAVFNEAGSNPGGSSGGTSGGGGGGRPATKPAETNKPTEQVQPTETNKPSDGLKTVDAGNVGGVFADVQNNAWYSEAIAYAYNNGMMNGTEKGFEPNAPTTRAMIVTMLHRLEKEPAAGASNFADVAGGQWFSEAVAWAAANGVVKGNENGTFAPNEEITREQLAAVLYRYAQFKGLDVSAKGDLSGFADGAAVSGWAEEAVSWAVGAGLLNGDDGRLAPTTGATRAEVAMMLMRFGENVK